jgi:hypothetical protein
MDEAVIYYEAVTILVTLGLTLISVIMFELRAQTKQREELNRLLIMSLFRMSKEQLKALEDQTRHVDALGGVLLRALRQGNVEPALLAEVQREVERIASLPREGAAPPAALPPGKSSDPEAKK